MKSFCFMHIFGVLILQGSEVCRRISQGLSTGDTIIYAILGLTWNNH